MLRLLALLIFPLHAVGGPWVEPGDTRLRHDLELLGDVGLITAPLTAWPLSWGDIGKDLNHTVAIQDLALRAAWQRVQADYTRASRAGAITSHARLALSHQPRELRTFSATPREEAEAEVGAGWVGRRLAYRLQATAVNDPSDGQYFRPDGTYAGMALGNWTLSAGWLDRWWGPGWEGSLIWSTNSRPIPAVTVQRNDSAPFEWAGLHWLGPWQFAFMMGQLDDHTTVPRTRFLGMRLNFKPLQGLELGLSRTAQWGGQGRPGGLDTLSKVLLGDDNTDPGTTGITLSNEPGNQLAGFDARWAASLFTVPYAVYGQAIGEDEAGGLPSRYIGLVGAETWGVLPAAAYSYRLHLEYADTAVDALTGGQPHFNTAYQHHIYSSGYTYRGRTIGHAMGGDGRMASLGALMVDAHGGTWEALLRRTEPNRDAPAGAAELALEGARAWDVGDHTLDLRLALTRQHDRASGARGTDTHIGLQWSREF